MALVMCARVVFAQAGEQVYWNRLDGWVALMREKPPVGATNDEMRELLRPVVETCGKLVMLRGGAQFDWLCWDYRCEWMGNWTEQHIELVLAIQCCELAVARGTP